MSLQPMRFRCLDECSHCCTWLPYYIRPKSVRLDTRTGKFKRAYEYFLGKQGVTIESWQVHRIRKLADKLKNRVDDEGRPIQYRILPSSAVTGKDARIPTVSDIRTYQIMGRTADGDICPFLSTKREGVVTPNGASACLIYDDRPLICRAYPLDEIFSKSDSMGRASKICKLDLNCRWVENEILSGKEYLKDPISMDQVLGLDYSNLVRMQRGKVVNMDETTLWKYATGVYSKQDVSHSSDYTGWVNWGWDRTDPEVQIEMLDRAEQPTGTLGFDQNPNTEIHLDISSFDNATYYFEAVVRSSVRGATTSLRNSNDEEEAVVESGDTPTYQRLRSSAFTPNNRYPRKRVSGDDSHRDWKCLRIIVV